MFIKYVFVIFYKRNLNIGFKSLGAQSKMCIQFLMYNLCIKGLSINPITNHKRLIISYKIVNYAL